MGSNRRYLSPELEQMVMSIGYDLLPSWIGVLLPSSTRVSLNCRSKLSTVKAAIKRTVNSVTSNKCCELGHFVSKESTKTAAILLLRLLTVCHYKLLKWPTCHPKFRKFFYTLHRSFFYLCATPVSFLCNGSELAWEKTNLPLVVECNIFLFFYLCTTAHSERLYVE